MAVPEVLPAGNADKAPLTHINLMVDTFIANTSADDLRAIIRSLLATSPPSVASQFKAIAQGRLKQINAAHLPSLSLFAQTKDGLSIPTPALEETLTRARSLYGAGMGFVSLRLLTEVIRRTIGIRWRDDDEVADILAVIDSDITQAIQSCKEEFDQSRVLDISEARDIVKELKLSIGRSMVDVQSWGGEYPFDRASASLDYWKF